jgi:cation:H+ antiporter
MENINFNLIILIFILSSLITWWAGITLAKTTDTLDTRWKIGEAMGGLILLGIAGSLPEIAVVYTAAIKGHIPVIIGTLIGGISIQTLIIVLFDFFVKKKRPLAYLAGSKIISIETIFAIIITILATVAMFIPSGFNIGSISPISIILPVAWIAGLVMIDRFRKRSDLYNIAQDAAPGRKHHKRRAVENHTFFRNKSTLHVVIIFITACIFTLIAGYYLEESSNVIATHFNIASGVFAATVIAFVTSLPEISTGLESIFIGDNQLAISDIVGGNAFMIVIFLLADIVGKTATLSFASHQDILFAVLGIIMMGVYAISFLKKPKKRYFRLGIDSIIVLLCYILGIYLMTQIR